MVTMAQAFAEGFGAGNEIIASANRSRARAAAIEQFGDVARDPELFTTLQNYRFAQNREQRAQEQHVSQEGRLAAQEGRAAAQEGRAATTFGNQQEDREYARQQQAVIGLVQGLRQARDAGEDMGAAFDRNRDLLVQLGVDPGDMDAMRQAVIDNPAVLDEYLRTLTGGDATTVTDSTTTTGTGTGTGTLTPQQQEARRNAEGFLNDISSLLDRLDESGGIRSEQSGVLGTIGRFGSSSVVGQAVGGVLGTENSGIRDQIERAKAMLLILLKNSNDLGQRLFDSDGDRETFMNSILDTHSTAESNRASIDRLRMMFGLDPTNPRTGTGDTVGTGDLPSSRGALRGAFGIPAGQETPEQAQALSVLRDPYSPQSQVDWAYGVLSEDPRTAGAAAANPPIPDPPPPGEGPSSDDMRLAQEVLANPDSAEPELLRWAQGVQQGTRSGTASEAIPAAARGPAPPIVPVSPTQTTNTTVNTPDYVQPVPRPPERPTAASQATMSEADARAFLAIPGLTAEQRAPAQAALQENRRPTGAWPPAAQVAGLRGAPMEAVRPLVRGSGGVPMLSLLPYDENEPQEITDRRNAQIRNPNSEFNRLIREYQSHRTRAARRREIIRRLNDMGFNVEMGSGNSGLSARFAS